MLLSALARPREPDAQRLGLTPMIDVTFQMLVFFLLTLRILRPEGDFDVRMPAAAPGTRRPIDADLPVTIGLRAGPGGRLASIQWGDSTLSDFRELRRRVRDLSAARQGTDVPLPPLELECDYQLRYEHVVDALTAVTAQVGDDGRTIVRLAEDVRLRPPRGGEE